MTDDLTLDQLNQTLELVIARNRDSLSVEDISSLQGVQATLREMRDGDVSLSKAEMALRVTDIVVRVMLVVLRPDVTDSIKHVMG